MNLRLSRIHPKAFFVIGILLAGAVVAFLQSSTDFLRNADTDILLRLRGSRPLSSNLLLVAIDESDIQALGGWPITRDYYGYLIHILTEKHARVIGLDVLLNTANHQYPEYDRLLADFIHTSGRVVLPNILDLSRPFEPSLQLNPLPAFAEGAAGVGFSNLGEIPTVRRVPLIVGQQDSLYPSFGLSLAKTFLGARIRRDGRHVVLSIDEKSAYRIPIDKKGCMFLNPMGCFSTVRSVGLTVLLQAYETSPDSMDFSDRLVLIAATAPSLPVIKSTPICSQVPASVIQATVAENILNKTWLRDLPFGFTFAWILAWMGLSFVISPAARLGYWIGWLLVGVGSAFGLSLGCLILLHLVMPLHLSLSIFLVAAVVFRRLRNRRQRQKDIDRMNAIETQIRIKENALVKAEQRLSETETQLAKEISEKKQLSETSRKLAEEKESAVLELEKQVRDLKASFEHQVNQDHPRFRDIIHSPDSPMTQILRMVEKVAKDDIPVLIQGETGTGKELIARAIHQASPRHRKLFIAINCGALSESLLESELFGHEKGAFTGAQSQRRGRFELAHGGTLFLDEITETMPPFQVRLLRVLQEGAFERVGGERTLRADVRIIAAHNKDLDREVLEKRFREDLYFRLKGFPINLPPLRNRREDVPVLIRFFVQKYDKDSKVQVSDAAAARLQTYRWPGNVRELENAVRRAVLLAKSERRRMIQLKDLPEEIQKEAAGAEPVLYHPLETQILEMLRVFKFSHAAIGQTARALGNRDRGTVTEYFRGLCFQFLARNGGDVHRAASAMAASDDAKTVGRVEAKMREYVENVRVSLAGKPFLDYTKPSCFKGLPQKFHPYLQRLIDTIL